MERSLDETLLHLEPIHVICLTAFTMVFGATKPSGVEQPLVLQHHAELLQALMLRHPISAYQSIIGTPDQVQTAIDLVRDFFEARTGMPVADLPEDEEQLAREIILADMRLHTQFIRGDFYGEQLPRLFRPVLEGATTAFHAVYGAAPEKLLDLLYALAKRIETRLNEHVQLLISFWRETSVSGVCAAYSRSFPHVQDVNVDQMHAFMAQYGANLIQLKSMLMAHSNLFVPDIFRIAESDIADELSGLDTSVDVRGLHCLLDRLSIRFGDLASVPIEYLPLDNPVWLRPLIRLDDNWLWPIPTGLIGFSPAIFQRLCDEDRKLKALFEQARATVLERKVAELFVEFLPEASVWESVHWRDPVSGNDYENDVVVLIDRWLLIIEAKSGQVTESARRGSFDRLKREVKKLVGDAAEQSKRLADYLESAPSPCRFRANEGASFEIEPHEIDGIIRLTVTLENIGRLNTRAPRLVEVDLIPTGAEFVPTISLGLLDVVFRSLAAPSAILHYLFRRREFEAATQYEADELDLLTFYLETGFNVGDVEIGEHLLMIYGHSNDLDFRLTQSHATPLGPQPAAVTRYWGRLIEGLETARPLGWIRLALRLRNFAWDDQQKIERMVRDAIRKVNRKGPRVIFGLYGPRTRREGMICLVHGGNSNMDRTHATLKAALQQLTQGGATDALFIKFEAPVIVRPTVIRIVENEVELIGAAR